MKILIIGGSGLVGQYLLREFRELGEVKGTFYNQKQDGLTELDLAQAKKIEELIHGWQPQTILLAAALTNVDSCEEDETRSYQINVEAPREVARIVEEINAQLVYFSTDYVFDGTAGPYREEATPNPINVYGRHKLAAENFIRGNVRRHLIIRTGGVYGWERAGKNFVLQLLHRLRARERAKVFTDQWGTPTYARDLAGTVRALIELGANGLFHVAGADFVSRLELGQAVVRTFDLESEFLEGVTSAEAVQKAKRPLRGGLRTEKLAATTGKSAPRLAESLAQMRSDAAVLGYT